MVVVKKKQQSTRPVYYKAITAVEVSVDVPSRTIKGYAAIWGVVDDANDLLVKGCCAKSITERGPESTTNRKILLLWMHDMKDPIAKISKLVEDDKGLYFEATIDKIPQGDRCLEQLNSGTLNQFSIGFLYVWDKCEWDNARNCFVVKEVNLFEISVVSYGMNEETSFEGLKGVQIESEQNQLQRETERALKALPHEDQYTLRQLITKHIALAEYKPGKPLEREDEPPATKSVVSFKSLSDAFKNN